MFAPEDGPIDFRALPGRHQEFIQQGDVVGVRRFIDRYSDKNIYIGVAARKDATSGKLENCSTVRALWSEIDFKHFASPDAARQRLESFPMRPSRIVHSGGGFHCYWRLYDPVYLHPENNELVKDLLCRLAQAVGGDLASAEVARILRLTGTYNHKPEYRNNGNPPPIVHVVESSDRKYNLYDFDWLPEIPQRQPPPTPKPNGKDPNSTRPGDDYAAKTPWREILEPVGAQFHHCAGNEEFWTRPGKKVGEGVSVSTNYGGYDGLFVWTSNWPPFSANTGYTKFTAYTFLYHNGDFKAAAKKLFADDFGGEKPDENPIKQAPSEVPEPYSLAEVEKVFDRWLPDGDPIPTRAVLAAYAANHHFPHGDPVWLMLVGGSGVGKTERLAPLSGLPDVVLESSITGPAALLSGSARKDRAKDATGGLLRKLPAGGGILVLKDFTSIIDMHRDARAEVLAALRELYDGRWDRSIGNEGGRTLTWIGRLGLLAGCTTAIDSAHGVIATMGTRFVFVRPLGNPNLAGHAYATVGNETTMREELRQVICREPIIALGSYVARARSPVDRDQRNDIRLVLDPEAPTRIVKVLALLWQAAGLLGLDHASSWEIVRRVGLDSIPKLRRSVLDWLASRALPATTTDIAESVEHPTTTTRRALEDLMVHGMVVKHNEGQGKSDKWELSLRTTEWLDRIDPTFPVLSEHHTDAVQYPFIKHKYALDDKTGKVPSTERVGLANTPEVSA